MGGQSFQCPHCGKWFMERKALSDHAKSKHDYKQPEVLSTGPSTELRENAE